MHIENEIVKAYLDGEKVSKFCSMWYFTNSSIAIEQEKNIFKEPVYQEEEKNKVRYVCEAIENAVIKFIPTNKPIWDVLFPNWSEIISNVLIDLIIGFPEPYDATVQCDTDGKRHVIFDMMCWSKYVGKRDVTEIVQNFLTHELFHILIGCNIPNIDDDLESKDYLTKLDAITFNEAFAHLVSYEAKEIDSVNWHTTTLEEVKEKCGERINLAIVETDKEKQKNNILEGICGKYYDKFACMSGMLYLAHIWEIGGNQQLKTVFQDGYHGFATKVSNYTKLS